MLEVRTGVVTGELPPVYRSSEVKRMLDVQRSKGLRTTALVSDFDRSYFRPDGNEDTKKLEKITSDFDIPTIIPTGNDYTSITGKIEANGLRKPEVLITSVGTEIYVLNKGANGDDYAMDENFQRLMEMSGFNRSDCLKGLQRLIGQWNIDPTFQARHLVLQQPEFEARFMANGNPEGQKYKVSGQFLAIDAQEREAVKADVQKQFPDLEVVVSEDVEREKLPSGMPMRYNLDLLAKPYGLKHGGKAGAVDYVEELLGIQRAFHVGDSGNDKEMLHSTALGEGILVGGSKPELTDSVSGHNYTPIATTGFISGPGRKKFFNAEGTNTYAAGSIIEAARRRLLVTLRFEQDPKMRIYINEIINRLH